MLCLIPVHLRVVLKMIPCSCLLIVGPPLVKVWNELFIYYSLRTLLPFSLRQFFWSDSVYPVRCRDHGRDPVKLKCIEQLSSWYHLMRIQLKTITNGRHCFCPLSLFFFVNAEFLSKSFSVFLLELCLLFIICYGTVFHKCSASNMADSSPSLLLGLGFMLVRVEETNKFCAVAVTLYIKPSVLALIKLIKIIKPWPFIYTFLWCK